ncbi:AraC family transcriptional regulator [Phormidesmis sp. 146-33]
MIETLTHERTAGKCKELATLVARHPNGKGNGTCATAIAPLEFMQQIDTCTAMHGVSDPILAIVVQGKKQVLLNEEAYRYGVAQYLVISVDLPLSGFAIEASPDQPYLT